MIRDHLLVAPLTSQDADALQELHGRYLGEAGVPVDSSRERDFLRALLHHDWVIALGATYEDRLVGFGLGNLTYSNIRCSLALHLGDLFVDRPYRGKGVDECLLDAIRDHAARRGVKRIFGNVAPRASHYFLRHGWQDGGQLFMHWDIGS